MELTSSARYWGQNGVTLGTLVISLLYHYRVK